MKTRLCRLTGTLALLACAFASAPAGAALITSDPLAQDGNEQSFKPPQRGDIGLFAFANPAALASITGLELTLTMTDGDTANGQFDAGDLRLVLDGIDTGLLLDGFANGQTVTQTLSLTNLDDALAQSLYAALIGDGALSANILDTDNDTAAGFRDHVNGKNFLTLAGGYNATLSLSGTPPASAIGPSAVPEPATLALAGLGLAGVGLSRRRRPA
jgi:PEP-CTERM motif-containing protein